MTKDTTNRIEEIENPYDDLAQKLFDSFQTDYNNLCEIAIRAGFPKPRNPHTTYGDQRAEEEREDSRIRARQEVQIRQASGQLGFEVVVATLVNTPVEMKRISAKMAQALKEALNPEELTNN